MCFFDAENDKIVAAVETSRTPAELAADVKERVPKYMAPNEWLILGRMPQTANGKIDRAAIKERYFHEQHGEN